MKLFNKRSNLANTEDSSLVLYSLGGEREAFYQIVSRYQNLLCSIAYSSIGDVQRSEDLAQETFVEAWKKLDSLQEPEKLKAWLCGILRFKISHFRRKEVNQPTQGADELEEHTQLASETTTLEDDSIKQQQQALMWSVLNDIDPKYREPLILFYREQQSIERVAQELDLSKDTAKQRLSRGRKMLKEAMSSFVEDGLRSSVPSAVFTLSVMTAISSIAPSAKAAVLGAGAAKTGSAFKLASVIAFLGIISGLISSFFGLRAALDQSRTQRERALAYKVVAQFLLYVGVFVAGMFLLRHAASANWAEAGAYAVMSQILVFGFIASYIWLTAKLLKAVRLLRAQERIFEPQAFEPAKDAASGKRGNYQSKLRLFGIPLISMEFDIPDEHTQPAVGWIAGGSYAYGLLFAWGGVAIAPVSVGIISVGVITIGAVGFGVISLGTVAVGVVAFGAASIAYKAYASLSSLGWESAFSNGFSIAREAAIGPFAQAKSANNETAAELVNLSMLNVSYPWVLAFIAFCVIVPSAWYAHQVRQRNR